MNIGETTIIVKKNFDRIHFCSEYLVKANLYVYVHEKNLHRKILHIYEAKKRRV